MGIGWQSVADIPLFHQHNWHDTCLDALSCHPNIVKIMTNIFCPFLYTDEFVDGTFASKYLFRFVVMGCVDCEDPNWDMRDVSYFNWVWTYWAMSKHWH